VSATRGLLLTSMGSQFLSVFTSGRISTSVRDPGMSPINYRAGHQLICELLHGVLRNAVQAGPGAAGGIGTAEPPRENSRRR
jgi:hypothetical protein